MIKNRKHKLVIKIFLGVVTIFTVVMLAQMFIQNYLINDIYLNEKTKRMEDSFEVLLESDVESNDFLELITDFRLDNNAPVIVFNSEFDILNENYFDQFTSITVASEGKLYKITMEAFVDELNDFHHDIKVNDVFEGILIPIKGTDMYVPLVAGGYNYSQLANTLDLIDPSKRISLKGEVIKIDKAEREEGVIGYQPDVLLIELLNLWSEKSQLNYLELNQYIYYDFVEERSGLHRYVYLGRLESNPNVYMVSMITMENVQDAFNILNDYYGVIFMVLILLTLILSMLLTRLITKPIIKLNQAALDIADKDFSGSVQIRTGDELETLAESLNAISNNMSQAFEDIEQSNKELAVEVIKRQENEERMRNMLSGLSHEFKTPLGIASGFIEIIKDGVGDKEPAYYLTSVEEELDRLNSMIRETIELTRLETGSYQLKDSTFAINDLIVQVYNRLNSSFNTKQQHILFELVDIDVYADKNKIEQVLVNLLSNANKYASENSTIEIEIKVKDKVWVYIRNDFERFSEAELSHLWDRFYRADKSRNKSTGGSGLGLTIVKNILELHGETYGARNTDKGIELYFSLSMNS